MHQIAAQINLRNINSFADDKKYKSFAVSIMLHAILILALVGIFNFKEEVFEIKINPVLIIGQEINQKRENIKKIIPVSNKKSNLIANNKPVLVNKKQGETLKNDYANLIANKLDQQKSRFDMTMAPLNEKTQVILKLHLDKSGNLLSQKIIKNSSDRFFDKTAQKLVEYASPLPKPPSDIVNQGLDFVVPIIFDTNI